MQCGVPRGSKYYSWFLVYKDVCTFTLLARILERLSFETRMENSFETRMENLHDSRFDNSVTQ